MPRKEKTDSKKKEAKVEAAIQLYSVNDKVLCKHIDNLYYEAKIICVDQPSDGEEAVYTVHYQGWNQRHDEKIPHSLTKERFLEHTQRNIEKARAELRDAQARMINSRKKGKRSLIDDKKGDSRGSTPSEKNIPRGASSSGAASVTSEKVSGQAAQSSKKRKKVSETEQRTDSASKNEIRIESLQIPPILKKILIDDQEMVRQMFVSLVPARVPVTEIIRQYAEHMASSPDTERVSSVESEESLKSAATMIESSYGVQLIQDYFNSTLGSQLLYKFERPQYVDLLDAHKKKVKSSQKDDEPEEKAKTDSKKSLENSDDAVVEAEKYKPAEQYGFIHLLRLFVRFGSMLSLTSWSERALQNILSHVHNFLKFLEVNRNKFFDAEADYIGSSPEYQKRVWMK